MLFFSIVAVGLAIDLITKSIVFDRFFDPHAPTKERYWWIDNVFGIETSTNGGALFGMGQGNSHIFAALSIVAVVGILFWLFIRRAAADLFLTFCLGLITAGILGNLYDRLGLGYQSDYPIQIKHHVRDWIHFRWEGISIFDPWPNFNIADSMLVCGALLLFVHAFFLHKPGETDADRAKPEQASST